MLLFLSTRLEPASQITPFLSVSSQESGSGVSGLKLPGDGPLSLPIRGRD